MLIKGFCSVPQGVTVNIPPFRDIRFNLQWDIADHSDVVPSLSSACLRCCVLLTVELFGNIFFNWGKSKGFYVIVQAKLRGYKNWRISAPANRAFNASL